MSTYIWWRVDVDPEAVARSNATWERSLDLISPGISRELGFPRLGPRFAVLKWVAALSRFRHPIILSRAALHDKWLIGWPLTKVSTHQLGNKQQRLLIFLCASPQNKMNQSDMWFVGTGLEVLRAVWDVGSKLGWRCWRWTGWQRVSRRAPGPTRWQWPYAGDPCGQVH